MKKVYVSNSILVFGLNVGKGRRNIRFTKDGVGSKTSYVSHDEEEQRALEQSSYFGRLYRLERGYTTFGDARSDAKDVAPKDTSVVDELSDGSADEVNEEDKENGSTHYVSSVQDARDVLEDNYGLSRSKLRNKAVILDEANKIGVNLVFEK